MPSVTLARRADARSARFRRACASASSRRRARSAAASALRGGAARRDAILRSSSSRSNSAHRRGARSRRRCRFPRDAGDRYGRTHASGGARTNAWRRPICAPSATRSPPRPPPTTRSAATPTCAPSLPATCRSAICSARSPTRSTNAAPCSTARRRRSGRIRRSLDASAGRRARPRRRDLALGEVRQGDSRQRRDDSRRSLRRADQGRVFGRVSRHRARHELERSDALRRTAGGARRQQSLAHAAHRRRARSRSASSKSSRAASATTPARSKPTSTMLAALDLLVGEGGGRAGDGCGRAASCATIAAIVVERGRHPLLGERAVPQSLALDDEHDACSSSAVRTWAARRVALKMVGLFVA